MADDKKSDITASQQFSWQTPQGNAPRAELQKAEPTKPATNPPSGWTQETFPKFGDAARAKGNEAKPQQPIPEVRDGLPPKVWTQETFPKFGDAARRANEPKVELVRAEPKPQPSQTAVSNPGPRLVPGVKYPVSVSVTVPLPLGPGRMEIEQLTLKSRITVLPYLTANTVYCKVRFTADQIRFINEYRRDGVGGFSAPKRVGYPKEFRVHFAHLQQGLTTEFPEDKEDAERFFKWLERNLATFEIDYDAYAARIEQQARDEALKEILREEQRFSHTWIVAPPRQGKTTLLTEMILRDLDEVAQDRASVILMDTTREFIDQLSRLQRFAPGGDLHGRLILIDAEDVEYTIGMPLFDTGLDQLNLRPSDREAMFNASYELLQYVFRSLIEAEFTSNQSNLLHFVMLLLTKIPGATLDTFIDLMQPHAMERYQDVLGQLDPDTQAYFSMKFDADPKVKETKQQVLDRLFAMKRVAALRRIFNAREAKLDLYKEMGKGKVILINASHHMLQDEGVELFGRYWIAQILLATLKRQPLQASERQPCYFYIDECHLICRKDTKLATFLDQARKLKVGMTLAHQRLEQITDPQAASALRGSTAIKIAGRLAYDGASAMAKNMGCLPEFITGQPPFHFARHTAGVGTDVLKTEGVQLSHLPRMSQDEFEAARADIRRRYAFTKEPEALPKREPEAPKESPRQTEERPPVFDPAPVPIKQESKRLRKEPRKPRDTSAGEW